MFHLRSIAAAAVFLAACTGAFAQTANSAAPSGSGSGANSVPQFPSGGATANGTAAGQNAASQFPSGGTAASGTSKIGAPTAVEQREQQKSDQDTKICKGC